jgi:hypothetical protein
LTRRYKSGRWEQYVKESVRNVGRWEAVLSFSQFTSAWNFIFWIAFQQIYFTHTCYIVIIHIVTTHWLIPLNIFKATPSFWLGHRNHTLKLAVVGMINANCLQELKFTEIYDNDSFTASWNHTGKTRSRYDLEINRIIVINIICNTYFTQK